MPGNDVPDFLKQGLSSNFLLIATNEVWERWDILERQRWYLLEGVLSKNTWNFGGVCVSCQMRGNIRRQSEMGSIASSSSEKMVRKFLDFITNYPNCYFSKNHSRVFPGSPVAKTPIFSCRWLRFNLWSGN